MCKQCRPQRQYIRLCDITERTSLRKHKTGRRCQKCRGDLYDTIVHFGEKGGYNAPYNWKRAASSADYADVILCLGSSLKVNAIRNWIVTRYFSPICCSDIVLFSAALLHYDCVSVLANFTVTSVNNNNNNKRFDARHIFSQANSYRRISLNLVHRWLQLFVMLQFKCNVTWVESLQLMMRFIQWIWCHFALHQVLKKYPCLWGMHKPANKRPLLYIVNLQWTPKDHHAALKING